MKEEIKKQPNEDENKISTMKRISAPSDFSSIGPSRVDKDIGDIQIEKVQAAGHSALDDIAAAAAPCCCCNCNCCCNCSGHEK